MNNIISEISNHFYFNLISSYIVLLISMIVFIYTAKKRKNETLSIAVSGFSLMSMVGQSYFLGVLLDNQMNLEYAIMQINFITIFVFALFIASITLKIKRKFLKKQ